MGLHTPSDGRAEPGKAVPAMAGAAQRLGATVIENCAVRCLETTAGRVSGVVTERGTVRANRGHNQKLLFIAPPSPPLGSQNLSGHQTTH
nr:FAD-dependent oxidoreductase [uncultured Cohaesibacter sp.]